MTLSAIYLVALLDSKDPMFESWYFSPLNHPGAAWLSAAIMLAVVLRKLPFFWAFVVGALAVTVADATVTGAWSKLGGESHVAFPVLSFFFVLFGDWRLRPMFC